MRPFCSMLFCVMAGILSAHPAQNSRTDTFGVAHYDIHLDISNISSHSISGYTTVTVRSKTDNLSSIDLDLLKLFVDSIQVAHSNVGYTYNDTLLAISLPTALNTGDTVAITIYYHGQPQSDASWGGFYFTATYAYNMGVGFSADPHSFGRAWFPCVDNFVDKALYDFHITTSPANRAMCNGILQSSVNNGNSTITWNWHMNKVIPSYLASVSVSNYTPVETSYIGIRDTFPIVLAAPADDTLDMVNSFAHLRAALAGYEKAFGPQPFERVGFTEVPFTGGAMEHAGNISYPSFAVDGTLLNEDLWAHELSHHWFGDMVTCETAEDMWLNEGWATFTANYFHEIIYGKESYKKAVRANHLEVLQYAYVKDNGYRAVYGIPHDYTYGDHVYHKGADIAHTLRGYLGDSAFFKGVTAHLQKHAYATSNSNQFRDDLSASSGRNMNDFFDDWVFNAGFPHFSIDSFTAIASGSGYSVTVYIRQKLKAATQYYNNVPLELAFFDANRQSITQTVKMSGHCGLYTTSLPFEPVYVALDMEEKISDAITDRYLLISNKGNYDFEEALMTMDVDSVATDTALVRVEHNWVYPDPPKTVIPGLHISKERYWKVDGIWPAGFHANANIIYNGQASTSGGYLDNLLFTTVEDSLVMLYRASTKDDWVIDTSVTLNTQGVSTNKKGGMIINGIRKGEYALAMWNHAVADSNVILDNAVCSVLQGIQELTAKNNGFHIVPNPASDSFRLELTTPAKEAGILFLYDMSGREVKRLTVGKGQQSISLSGHNLKKGVYLVTYQQSGISETQKLVIVD